MESIYFCLKYCYGIKSFCYTFPFDKDKKAHLIYAPNGTMKTSLANTLRDITLEEPVESRDRFYPEEPYSRVVKYKNASGRDLGKDEIFIIGAKPDYFRSDKMSLFLADQGLKNQYDGIHRQIEALTEEIVKKLKKLSGKNDALRLFCADFGISEKDFNRELCKILTKYSDKDMPDYSQIKYSNLFLDDIEKILSNPEVIEKLENYFNQLRELLNTSVVFRPEFSHTSAEDTLTKLDKNGFFKVGHTISLSGQEEKLGSKEYKDLIDTEKKRIIKEGLAEEFGQIDTILRKNNASVTFRSLITEHQELIPELRDISKLKQEVWISYLFLDKSKLSLTVTCFEESKERIEKLIGDANSQQTEWQDVVDEFNRRFINMPCELYIENKEDVILEAKAPALGYRVKTGKDIRQIEEPILLKCLSEGETRALYLLNVLFEIEALRKKVTKVLLIIDDIADSFDYKNKYAIIEYLIGIIENQEFYPIILTHNFDFYRTLASRVGLKKSIWFAEKNNGDIHLTEGEYTSDVFNTWKNSAHSDARIFVSSISFLRNLAGYQYGEGSENYKKYTSLLHYKKHEAKYIAATEDILIEDLIDWVNRDWQLQTEVTFDYQRGESAFSFIKNLAESIASSPETPIQIEYKICLSIAIRLLAEKYMISRIDDDAVTDAINSNQTRKLRNLVVPKLNMSTDSETLKLLDRVLIMTSENIHINSFMYEPIIDLSLDELKKLYNDVSRIIRV